MTRTYAQFEKDITRAIANLSRQPLPNILPGWMENIGINPGATIISATDIGPQDHKNKTDILVNLDKSKPLKISVKMQNADYMGNWYTHTRIIDEFGQNIFDKITKAVTNWSNQIAHDPSWENKPFVGVSISFGRRSGKTGIPLQQIFSKDECNKIVVAMGAGIGSDDSVANSLYASDIIPNNVNHLINSLKEMNYDNIIEFTGDFMLILRPINPMTEGSNRGKNVFSQFVPNQPLSTQTRVTTMSQLNALGSFQTVHNDRLNHNRILDNLDNKNIIVPRKRSIKK